MNENGREEPKLTDQKHNRSPDKKSQKERIKEITEKLEEGVKAVFESDRYKEYLACMSKFHRRDFSMNHFHTTTAFSLAMTINRCQDTPASERLDRKRSWEMLQDRIKDMHSGLNVLAARSMYSKALLICFPLPRS